MLDEHGNCPKKDELLKEKKKITIEKLEVEERGQ